MVLQVLYDQIKDKSKILTQKRVVKVDVHDKGVKAITQDGSVYTGDIIVGADGIHSTVREEMWRIANTLTPGYIPSSERTGEDDFIRIFYIGLIPLFSHALYLFLHLWHFQSLPRHRDGLVSFRLS